MIAWHEWNRYWHKRMPILNWLPHYDLQRDLKFDLIAGFTVAVMLVPQEMSFAALMGVPAQYGLYTAATAPLLYPLFGSSRALSVANAAEGSLLVGVMLRAAEIQSVEERVATGILLTFFAGLIMVCFGILHQGGVVSFFSRTSMNGYITATAFLIITSQLPGWLGITLHKKTPLTMFTLIEICTELPNTNWYSFVLGVFALVFLSATKHLKAVLVTVKEHAKQLEADRSSSDATTAGLIQGDEANDGQEDEGDEVVEIELDSPTERGSAAVAPLPRSTIPVPDNSKMKTKNTAPTAPLSAELGSLHSFFASRPRIAFGCSIICDSSALIVCVVGMVVGAAIGEDAIKLTGVVPSGLPVPVFPPGVLGSVLPWDRIQSIVTNATTIAVIFFMSSAATGSKLANQAGYEISPNQELLGLGFANLGASFFQGMPSTAGLSRSAVNAQSAHTPLASMVTAVLVIVTLLFLTGPLYYLPQAPLSAIILLSARSLIDFTEPKWLKRVSRHDLYVWLAAFCGTLVCGLLRGLLISVLASVVVIMAKSKKPRVLAMGQRPDGTFGEVDETESSPTELQDVVVVRMAYALYFGNASHFIHGIEHKLDAAKARGCILGVVVDGSRMNTIDASAIHALKEYHVKLRARDQQLTFANLTLETATSLVASGLWKDDHQRPLMGNITTAVDFLRGQHR